MANTLTFVLAAFLVPPALAQPVSFGFIGGTNLTRDLNTYGLLYPDSAYPDGLTTFLLYSDTTHFLAGFTVEFTLSRRFSVEADALHRNLEMNRGFVFPSGETEDGGSNLIGTWEWPVLFKWRLRPGPFRPFLEAGPSFRTRKNPVPTEPSQFGVTAGLGVEFRMGPFKIAPVIRYTRWQSDPPYPHYATRPDQIELLTGISYATSPRSWRLGERKFHLGVVGGTNFTGGLQNQSNSGASLSESTGYAVGLMAEFALTRRLSAEVNGIYRPLRAHTWDEFTVLTWQFPVLAKYHLQPIRRWQPVIEAGPSFRLSGNLNGYNPSHFGLTAGAGAGLHVGGVRIEPVIRYTRWAADSVGRYNYAPRTAPNQVELLVGLSF